jgi:hypothetical protein
MTRTCTALVLALTLLGAAVGDAAGAGGPEPTEEATWERYEVLLERNIFARRRGRTAVASERPEEPPPPTPERYVYLRGVTRVGDEFVAFLEDTRSGQVTQVHAGEEAVRGEVSRVWLGGIGYVQGGGEVEVAVGENLEKSASAQSAGPVAETEGGEAATHAAGAPPSDLLERLRQRRQEELGR